MGVPKNERPQVGSVADLLWLGLIVVALLVVGTLSANRARGADCVTCRQFVRQTHAVPLTVAYAAAPYQPVTMNFVGAPIRMQAAQQYAMENAPEWEEFQAFRAFRAGYAAAHGQPQQPPGGPQTLPPPAEAPEATPQPQATPAATADPQRPYLAQMVVTAKVCGGCHGDKNPQEPAGGLYLNGMTDLRGAEKVELRDDILGRMLSVDAEYRMPRGRELSAEELSAIVDENWGGRPAPANP